MSSVKISSRERQSAEHNREQMGSNRAFGCCISINPLSSHIVVLMQSS